MFKFLLGVAFGAAGYWAWQSFGRDLLGLHVGLDQQLVVRHRGTVGLGSVTRRGWRCTAGAAPLGPSS